MASTLVTNQQLKEIRDNLITQGKNVKAWMIAEAVDKQYQYKLDESTVRGRFISMGEPLSGIGGVNKTQAQPQPKAQPIPQLVTQRGNIATMTAPQSYDIPDELRPYIPPKKLFDNYIERPVDRKLALHYNLNKHPITQGKQGTGKTFSHMYYAYKQQLPCFLYSCHEDFKLRKLFGDKTIENGSIKFREGFFVKALQHPSLILFDEINAVSNANTFDFHALLQNRELFVKDANDGGGKLYRLHNQCRIGFAQNPKSAKYIGGNIKPSNFLGRCTFITYPEFKKQDISTALQAKFPTLDKLDLNNFVTFYFACINLIRNSDLPLDISIRQLINIVELWINGLELKDAIEDGLSSMLEAVSQPEAKESFTKLSEGVWKELMVNK